MKKYLILILTILVSVTARAHQPSLKEYQELFKHYDACFILYHINDHRIVSEYNPNHRCDERISPNSTFKVALSLMAFNQGIIKQDTVFKWDKVKRVNPDWNHGQTPKTWLENSVVWVSQKMSSQLGYDRIKRYLAGFNYGNQDFKGDPGQHNGLQYAWLSSSLKISAMEQLRFLKAMAGGELPLNPDAIENTKKNMYIAKLDNGASYYGKTGSGRHGRNERQKNPSHLRDGWFIGFVDHEDEHYIFVSNLTDKVVQTSVDPSDGALKPYGSQVLKPITMKILNTYFSK